MTGPPADKPEKLGPMFACPACRALMEKPAPGSVATCPACGSRVRRKIKTGPVASKGSVKPKERSVQEAPETGPRRAPAIAMAPSPTLIPVPAPAPPRSVMSHQTQAFRMLVFIGILCVLFALVLNLIALVLAIPAMRESIDGSNGYIDLLLGTPFIESLVSISSPWLAGWVAFLAAAVFASYFVMFKAHGRDLVGQLTSPFPSKNKAFETGPHKHRSLLPVMWQDNGIIMVLLLFMAVTFFSYFIALLLNVMAVQRNAPPFSAWPNWYLYIELLNASVWEEVADRVLLLGLALLIVRKFVRKDDTPWYRFLIGGKIKFDMDSHFLVLVSAAFFGLGHIGGWDVWRFFDTFVGGVAMAYLFLRFGVQASIMLHFLIDYYDLILTFPGFGALDNVFIIIFFITFTVGGMLFIYFAWRVYHAIVQDKARVEADRAFRRPIYHYMDLSRTWKPVPVSVGRKFALVVALMLLGPLMYAGMYAMARPVANTWVYDKEPSGDEPVYTTVLLGGDLLVPFADKAEDGQRVIITVSEMTGRAFDIYIATLDRPGGGTSVVEHWVFEVEEVEGFMTTTYYLSTDKEVALIVDNSALRGINPDTQEDPGPLFVNVSIGAYYGSPVGGETCIFGMAVFILYTIMAGIIAVRRSKGEVVLGPPTAPARKDFPPSPVVAAKLPAVGQEAVSPGIPPPTPEPEARRPANPMQGPARQRTVAFPTERTAKTVKGTIAVPRAKGHVEEEEDEKGLQAVTDGNQPIWTTNRATKKDGTGAMDGRPMEKRPEKVRMTVQENETTRSADDTDLEAMLYGYGAKVRKGKK